MSETEINPAAPPEPVAPVPPPPAEALAPPVVARPRRSFWPLLGVLGFLVLAGGEGYLWHLYQQLAAAPPDQQTAAAAPAPVPATSLPSASVPAASMPPTSVPATAPVADIAPLQAAITALQAKLAALPQVSPPAPASQPSAQDQQAVAQAEAAVQQQAAMAADLSQKLATLNAQVNALETEQTADHGAVTALQTSTAGLGKLNAQVAAVSRASAARAALEAGQPLGDIPGAPPALAKFAQRKPPTQAALVLAFPAAARRAESASIAGNATGTYWSSVLARLENLVTISSGNRVLIGAPAAGAITQARQLLDAGDLAGAVAALDSLSATTQAAMGDWLTQARDLLAARAALVSMAGQN